MVPVQCITLERPNDAGAVSVDPMQCIRLEGLNNTGSISVPCAAYHLYWRNPMALVLSVLSLCGLSLRLAGPNDTGAVSVDPIQCIRLEGLDNTNAISVPCAVYHLYWRNPMTLILSVLSLCGLLLSL